SCPLVVRLSLTQLKLRAPAWYGESIRLTTTPSRPLLMLSSKVLVSSSAELVVVRGAGVSTVEPPSTSPRSAYLSPYGTGVRSFPLRWGPSKQTRPRAGPAA